MKLSGYKGQRLNRKDKEMKLNKGDWYVIYRALELAKNSDVGSFYREETMEKVKEEVFGGEE